MNQQIKSINLKYPGLMSEHAEEYITDLIYKMYSKSDELQETRAKVRELEKELEQLQKDVNTISQVIDIEYVPIEHRGFQREECNLQIINPTDYRNHD